MCRGGLGDPAAFYIKLDYNDVNTTASGLNDHTISQHPQGGSCLQDAISGITLHRLQREATTIR
jgi:hypothetical protein